MRFSVTLMLLILVSVGNARGQQVMPQLLTLNLKFPSPKSANEGFRWNNTHQLPRNLGPIRNANGYPQPTIQQSYLVDPNLSYVPWQFNERSLGLPGFSGLQLLHNTTAWNWESAFEVRPLAPTKVRRSQSYRGQ
jgi:hypothetical protein